MTSSQKRILEKCLSDFRMSGLFSNDQIRKALCVYARHLPPPKITAHDLQNFFRLHGIDGWITPKEDHPVEPSANLTPSGLSADDRLHEKRESTRLHDGEWATTDIAVASAANVVKVSAAIAATVAVLRNFVGSVKDSFDISKHLRERSERISKIREES